MSIRTDLNVSCVTKKEFCRNCHSQFMSVRPLVKSAIVSKRFMRDFKDTEKMNLIIDSIIDCSALEFSELHKYEANIDGTLFFRAKKDGLHIVYCVDNKMRIVFLRAIANFSAYQKFLDNKKELRRMAQEINRI